MEHSVWRGSISFGLVNIPVRLYHASRDRELKFKLLHKKDLSEIRYVRVCKTENKEVPWEDIVKGFEVEEGKYVVFTDEDFKKANPKKSQTFEISSFADENEIDSVYYHTPYYLEPEKGAIKAYNLLRKALGKAKKVGIGTFVFRNHEHLGLIKAEGDVLLVVELRFHQDMVSYKDLNIPKDAQVPKKEMEVALEFITKLSEPFNPKDYSDTYTKEVKALIKQKSKGQKVKVKKGESPRSPKVQDIMSLLKRSLEEGKKKRKSA